jgi:transposase-like protein
VCYEQNFKGGVIMKINKITYQNRRDFSAIYECEDCGSQEKMGGYDDRNFHDNVIPNFKCKKCGKSRNDLGITQEPTSTKYQAWQVI